MSAKLERSNGFYFDGNDLVLQADQLLLPDGSAAAPSLSFASDPDTGIFLDTSVLRVSINNSVAGKWASGFITTPNSIRVGTAEDLVLTHEAANILAQVRGSDPQTFKLYEISADASNYERYAFIASGNQLEIQAQTLGTGNDDLDIALTPAGTGNVKFGTYGAEVAAVAGYITIKDAGGTPRKLAVIA